jgi:hypothetical protein
MAYKPNPDRKVVNGKAVVSAKELADFQAERGSDKTLRDLLNADKGLSRKKEAEDLPKTTDAKVRMSRQSGPPTTTQGATYPKPSIEEGGVKSKSRSSWDSTFGEDAETGFDRAKRGESPFNDAIMNAGKLAIAAMPVGRALSAVRPAIGAAVKYMTKKDKPISKEEDPAFSSGRSRDSLFGDETPNGFKKGGAANQYTKGGKINLGACGVSTHVPSKKNSNW